MQLSVRRVLAIVTCVALVWLLPHESAMASESTTLSGAECGRSGCNASVETESKATPAAKPVDKSSPPPCQWSVATGAPGLGPLDANGNPASANETGSWYQVSCPASNPNFGPGAIPVNTADVPTYLIFVRTADPTALRQQALANLSFQVPQLRFNPGNMAIVNSPAYLWLDGLVQQTATANAGAASATVVATPKSVTWTMGDGNTKTCNGPGVPFDPADPNKPGTCSYSYKRSSAGQPNNAYVVTATVEWATSWTATGIAGGGALGAYSSSNTAPLPVGEIQAVNVNPGVSK